MEAGKAYNEAQISKVLGSLEYMTHQPTFAIKAQIINEDDMKAYRMSKMKGFVDTINENVQTNTQLSLDSLIENPKLVSFKLMKMDMEQSCRA